MNLNKAFVLGRLTRDPETRSTTSGQNVTNFSIATNRVWNDQQGNRQESTEFHNIVAFGKLADICSQYLNKGKLVLIEGRIQTRSWEDQNGNKKYRTEILAENMQMGPGATNQSNNNAPSPSQANNNSQTENKQNDDIPVIDSEEPITNQNADQADQEEQNQNEVNVKNIPF